LKAAIKLNTWLSAMVMGSMLGLSLLALTYISLYRGLPDTGQYLNLLGVFLPGYEVSHAGAWIGLFWGFVIGAFLAVLLYRVYARGMVAQLAHFSADGSALSKPTEATFVFEGKSLGLALGSVAAIGLLTTTNWLVLRGTADESSHAELLMNFLPGYSVSVMGSLIGAAELFFVTFVVSIIFSSIYNRLARQQTRNNP